MKEVKAPMYFEDVEVGADVPPVIRKPVTYTQLVIYCGVAGVFDPVHFDRDAALANGFPDLITNGSLRVAALSQMLSDWVLPYGKVLKFGCQHRGMALIGDPILSKGTITGKYVEDGKGYIECDIWNETPRAGKTDVGTAVVTLPLKS